jgi:uncharacterized protein (DUF302 family)
MHMRARRWRRVLAAMALAGMALPAAPAAAADNPALIKYQARGAYDDVLHRVKAGLEEKQFLISHEDNLAKALEANKHIFLGEQWNTLGFKNAVAVHFCSLTFNQEVFNTNMDWSVLCPFKVVVYNMKANPELVYIVMTRPSYIFTQDADPRALEIGRRIDERITSAIREGVNLIIR